MHDQHTPHLALNEVQSLKDRVFGLPNSQRLWSPGIIINAIHKIVPSLAIPIQGPDPMPFKGDIIAAEEPRTGAILEADRRGIRGPVCEIRAPEKRARKIDIDVVETGGVHERGNVVCCVEELDGAALSTLRESLSDRWGIVASRRRINNASIGRGVIIDVLVVEDA